MKWYALLPDNIQCTTRCINAFLLLQSSFLALYVFFFFRIKILKDKKNLKCELNTKRNMTLIMCTRWEWRATSGRVLKQWMTQNCCKVQQQRKKKPHRWVFTAVHGWTFAIWLFYLVRCEYLVNMNKTFMIPEAV